MSYEQDMKDLAIYALQKGMSTKTQKLILEAYMTTLDDYCVVLSGVVVDMQDHYLLSNYKEDKKVSFIKRLREISGCSLREAKELMDDVWGNPTRYGY